MLAPVELVAWPMAAWVVLEESVALVVLAVSVELVEPAAKLVPVELGLMAAQAVLQGKAA